MSSQTLSEQLKLSRDRQLQRIVRANPDHFRFSRETPRKLQRIPFVADRRELIELRDAVVGLAIFAALIVALATAPWWLA